MENFYCPHCKKKIELGEVTKKQAEHLAAQKFQKFKDFQKDSHKKDIEKAKEDGAKKAIKEEQDKHKKKIKQFEDDKKKQDKEIKLIKEKSEARGMEKATAIANANAEKKFRKDKEKSDVEKAQMRMKMERMKKDLDKAHSRADQGLTADQGAATSTVLGQVLKEIFADTDDEIIPYGTGESGADWLQKVKKDGLEIGRILYESKETENFAQKWYGKLQEDMDDANADVGIIFTTAVPREFDRKKGFIERGNQFVCNRDFDKLKMLAVFQRKMLDLLNLINKDKSQDNKKSALEFFNSPEMQNLLGLLQNKVFDYEAIVGKQEKLTRDMKQNYLGVDGIIDQFFKLTAEFGLKKKDKK
tara:strand:- start:584 stop:1657 length:1074 start_codon:yes stop_codon:yes gene_type:complete